MESYYNARLIEAGLDEVGCGCIAGPVFGAAVIFPKDYYHPGIKDSKLLSRKQRETIFDEIVKSAIACEVAEVSVEEIDRVNILHARMQAMRNAVSQLIIQPQQLIVDGDRFFPYPNIQHKCFVKGDSKYLSIAAASILAKVSRDELMSNLAKLYPEYGWEENVGYPTPKHRAAIKQFGITPYHRKSFKLI